jgi:hypothetical protein
MKRNADKHTDAALGDFYRASRNISALTKVGRVNCTPVQIGGTPLDFYRAV